jgi:hypothetical protein
MKFKLDFVTNSSSTSYIVHIPQNFVVSPQDIRDFAERELDEELFEETPLNEQNDLIEEVVKCVEDVKNGHSVYESDNFDSKDSLAYNYILHICNKNNFKIDSQDIGGGGGVSIIIGITLEKIQKIDDEFNASLILK